MNMPVMTTWSEQSFVYTSGPCYEPRSGCNPSSSPPFCSGDDKSMSLTEPAFTQVQGENGTEYHLITTPVTVGEDGVIHVQQVQGAASLEQQENIDPNTHVLMLQPITITEDGQQIQQVLLQGHQVLGDNGQIQILQEGFQFQEDLGTSGVLQETQIQLQLSDLNQQQQLQLTQLQPAVHITESGQEAPTVPAHRATQEVKPPVGKGPFRCEICDKMLPKWNQLQRHLRGHDEDKPHRCPHCASTFNVESNLKLHIATHVSENPICPECGKKFSRIASLKAHIMLHEKEENLMCPECGDEFSLQSQLDKHMREHREEQAGTKSYPCKQCTMEYSKLSLLREHMKQHYKIKHSLSHRTYKRNVDRTGFSHKCAHCLKTFQKPSQLERHVRIHTGERPYKCTMCDKAFNQKGALHIHLSKHTGDRPHMCEFCPATFAQKGNLRAHIQRVHSHPKDSDAPMYQCDECSCVFKKLGSLNAHISRVHTDGQVVPEMTPEGQIITILPSNAKELKEAIGDQIVATPVSVEGQKTVNDVIQQLLEMSEQVSDPEATQQQIQQIAVSGNISSDLLQQALENSGLSVTTENSQVPGTSKATVSTVMNASTTTSTIKSGDIVSPVITITQAESAMGNSVAEVNSGTQSVVTATMTIHDSATGTVKRHLIRKVNGVRWHQCTYCSKEFKKPSDLVRHIRIHTHEKPYKCSLCFRSFAVKSTLTAHVKTHTGVKEFRCQVCDKLFSTQGSLKVHLRLHTGAKPFSCPDCDKKFRTSGHRKSHMQSHYKENSPRKPRRPIKRVPKPDIPLPDIPMQEPIIITDTGLIQQPPRNSQVYNQFLGEAGSVDRPYKCGYCSRGFKKSSHLKQHIRSHTGEKPYKCVQCLRAFVSSGVLKAHIRTHTGVKSYKCPICDATFTTNGSLKRHMSTHSEVRPFMCPYCQKTFKTSVNCKKHMKTHRHELAMQALNQDGITEPVLDPEKAHEVTIGPDMVDDDDDEDDDDDADAGVVHTVVEETQLEVTAAAGDLQTQLNQEQQTAALALQQQEFGTSLGQASLEQPGHTTLVTVSQAGLPQQTFTTQDLGPTIGQQTVIQDSLVTDPSLQSTLSHQLLGQNFQQETLNQTVLGNQSAFSQLSYSQFGLQSQPPSSNLNSTIPTSLDPSFATTAPSSLTSTSMQNILQTTEHDGEDQELSPTQPSHQVVIHQELDENQDIRRTYRCGYCEKAFKKSSHLKQHIRSHTGERPFKCMQCSRQFVSMGVLKAHMRTHSGVKDFRCSICQATFTTNGSLTRHMMIHSTIHPFKCPYCPEAFRTAFHCRRHMRLHRDNQDEENDDPNGTKRARSAIIQITEEQAEVLSKTSPDESMSVSEKLLIQSAAEKDRVSEIQEVEVVTQHSGRHHHVCPHCPKSFKKPSDLVRHLRIHTGEKPYACEICSRSFTVKSTLDSHVKTHQGALKTYKCHVCTSGFSTKGSLKVHMRLHTGAKPFKCPHCEQRFRTSGHRKSHIASHFKPVLPKKPRKVVRTSLDMQDTQQQQIQQINLLNDVQNIQNVTIPAGQLSVANQVISMDSAGNIIPGPIALQDTQQYAFTDSGLATQVLQNLDGVQLQLTTGGLGQGIQITGLDPSLLNQTLQIDASLLQQLQSHGMANLTINPSLLQTQGLGTVDPNTIQNIQVQQTVPISETLNPNVVIQQPALTSLASSALGQSVLTQQTMAGQDQVQMSTATSVGTSTATDQNTSLIVTTNQQQLQQQLQQQQQQQQQLEGHHLQQQQIEAGGAGDLIQPKEEEDMGGDDDSESDHDDSVVPEGVSDDPVSYDKLESSEMALPMMSQEQTGTEGASDTATIQFTLQPLSGTGVLTADSLLTSDVTSTPITVQPSDTNRNHICQVCNKAFKRMGHLKEHLLTHAPGPSPSRFKPTPHRCTTCDKSFAKPSQLERHFRIHTGERPYQCSECNKAFNQKNALMVHLKKHRGERPHRCPYCELAFTQKGNLKTHIKRAHHIEMVQSMNIPKDPTNTSTTDASSGLDDDHGEESTVIVQAPSEQESIDLDGVVKELFPQ